MLSTRLWRSAWGCFLLALSALAAALSLAPAPAGATASVAYYASVGGTGDCSSAANACSLSTALSDAGGDGNAGANVTINLAGGTYPLASTIDLGSSGSEASLTLDGAGASATLLDGQYDVETMQISGPYPVTLESLTLENGNYTTGGDLSVYSAATLRWVAVSAGGGTNGGGIAVQGGAPLTVEDSTISGDAGNSAVYVGSGATLDLLDSTVATPDASYAVEIDSESSSASIFGSTIFDNHAGLLVNDGNARIGASVLTDNGEDCAVPGTGTITDEGYNYAADDATCAFSATGSRNATPVNESDIGSYGGPTQTVALTSSSAAYDAVPTGATLTGDPETGSFCAGTDQRGIARTQGPASGCTPGAFQYAPPVVTSVSPRSSLELGLPLTLSGYGFADLTSATFGSTVATIASQSDTSITLSVPGSLSLGSQPITLTNPDGSATVPFSAVASPSITTSILTPGQLKVPYSQTISIAGGAGPYSYALVSGALPAGLSLASSGVVSGTPTKAGGSAFAVQVTDANGIASATVDVSLVIATPVISVASTRVKVISGAIPVTISCAAAPCAGHLTLNESVTVTKHHKKKLESVALASTTYSLGAGQTGTFDLTLSPQGHHALSRHALKKAKKHPLHETLQATVSGGTTDTAAIALS